MRIIIVGAGAVGSYLAQRLSVEGQDVVVIEGDEHRAGELQNSLDALVVTGNGASPSVLKQAGAELAQMVIAVSNSDGANVLSCHAAHELGVPRTVARIEDPDVRDGIGDLGVDVVIDPGENAAQDVLSLLGQRGASDRIQFADGQLTLLGGIARPGSPIIGHRLSDLRAIEARSEWALAAVVRAGEALPVRGETVVLENDHVLVMTRSDDVSVARQLLGLGDGGLERVIVLGSTRMAELTIDLLIERRFEVVAVDHDENRCLALSDHHARSLVIHGDPTDPAVLQDIGVNERDAIVALTGWDDANLTGCLVGKALGASTAIARFHRLSYVGLLTGAGIDAAVSSRLAAANAILRFVRRGRIHSVATFKDTRAEAIEIEVEAGSVAADRTLAELSLPPAAVVGGVARRGAAFVPRGSTVIEVGDRLIFVSPPEAIPDVEAVCSA